MSCFRAAILCLSTSTLLAPGVSGQAETRMVADLNDTVPERVGESPRVAVMGGFVYYAGDGVSGRELYRSSIAATGPRSALVADVHPGPLGSKPFALTAVGNILFFAADDGLHGVELWRSDGTAAGTQLVADINPGLASSMWLDPACRHPFGVLRNRVFFGASDGIQGRELWSSDGTRPGTLLVSDMTPGKRLHSFHSFLTFRGYLLFTTAIGLDQHLCCTDGTAAGTRSLTMLRSGPFVRQAASRTVVAGDSVFVGGVGALHCVRVGPAGQLVVSSSSYGALEHRPVAAMSSAGLPPRPAVILTYGASLLYSDGQSFRAMALQYGLFSYDQAGAFLQPDVYFIGFDLAHGNELWRTDGSPAGTALLADLRQGPMDSVDPKRPALLAQSGSRFFLVADDGLSGPELWVSDGSRTGTRMCADLNPGSAGSNPRRLTPVSQGALVFVADHPTHGTSLWLARGSPVQVSLLDSAFGEQAVRTADDHIGTLYDHEGGVYFAADDGRSGSELWRSDGTAAGTNQVLDIHATGSALRSHDLVNGSSNGDLQAWRLGNELLFTAYEAGDRLGLWRSSGTSATTVKIVDLSLRAKGLGYPLEGAAIDDAFYYRGFDSSYQPGIWRTFGGQASTARLHASTDVSMFERLGRQVVYATGDRGGVTGVAASDAFGVSGRSLVQFQTTQTAPDYRLMRVGRRVVFCGDGALWTTDGTVAGTSVLGALDARRLAVAADVLLALSYDAGTSQTMVYLTDGVSAPRKIVTLAGEPGLVIGSNSIFWFSIRRSNGSELWMCDSVAAKHLATFPNGLRPADQARVQELAPLGDGRAVFTVSYDERFGCEPWISDGTVTGTAVAVDLNPGPASSDPGEFVLSKGAVLFVADPDGGSDRRLHTMSVGATARYHGPGAAASGYVARLHCTDPIRGGKMDLVLSDAPASSAGLLLIGRPKWPATKLGAGAYLYVDLSYFALLSIATDPGGGLKVSGESVPMDPTLKGFELVVQAVIGPTAQLPFNLDFSDAVYLLPF